jgi:hypothetical protein
MTVFHDVVVFVPIVPASPRLLILFGKEGNTPHTIVTSSSKMIYRISPRISQILLPNVILLLRTYKVALGRSFQH